MYNGDSRSAIEIVKDNGWLVQDNVDEIQEACSKLLDSNEEAVKEYTIGDERTKQRLLKFFMGELMKQSQGKLHPKSTNSVLLSLLNKYEK